MANEDRKKRRLLDGTVTRSVIGVAQAMGLSVPSVRRLLRRGELGSCRIGRRVMIPQRELERFLARRTIEGR